MSLEGMFYSLNVEEIIEEMKNVIGKEKNINPNMKLNIVVFSEKILKQLMKDEKKKKGDDGKQNSKQKMTGLSMLGGLLIQIKMYIEDGNSEIRE